MLSSLVKEHQSKQQAKKEEQERRRKEALLASTNLSNALVDHLNVGVAQAYLNQKRLDAEARRLEQSAAVFQKQTQQWINLVNGFCSSLKQLGDVTSWAGAIHKDITEVTHALKYAYNHTYASCHPHQGSAEMSSSVSAQNLLSLPSLPSTASSQHSTPSNRSRRSRDGKRSRIPESDSLPAEENVVIVHQASAVTDYKS